MTEVVAEPAGPHEDDLALHKIRSLSKPIDKYLYLRELFSTLPNTYYTLLLGHTEEIMPYIYTPTVGEACQKYHELPGLEPHGLYLTLSDRGRIKERLAAWPQQEINVVVVTDGERILGLGDLGANGMGISEGKITLYTVAAGVDPHRCMPVCLDVGTNNPQLLNDPHYKGLRRKRATGEEYDSFIAEFMEALHASQPHVLVQFEDFGNNNAFRVLDRYRSTHCCFNDDIQGTACITLAALLSALKGTGGALQDQRLLFLGAGEAGTGIGELVSYWVHRRTGRSMHDARQVCYFLDSKGLVCSSRSDLQHHKQPFAHDVPYCKDLKSAINAIQPTALIGVSAQPNSFDEEVVRTMSRINDRPIIFPLSNPTSKSECTFEQAYRWSNGRVLFASGSPYAPLQRMTPSGGSSKKSGYVFPAQANNAYVFPALGHAALLTQAKSITDDVFLAAAETLSQMTTPEQVIDEGRLFPPFSQILSVSARVMAAVGEQMVASGLGARPAGCTSAAGWEAFAVARMWCKPRVLSRV